MSCWTICPTITVLVLAIAIGLSVQFAPAHVKGVTEFLDLAGGCIAETNPWCTSRFISAVLHAHYAESGAMYTDTGDEVAARFLPPISVDEPLPLAGKVAIVTGATSGIGKETSRILMRYGCHVVMPARSVTKGRNVLKELEKEAGDRGGRGTVIKMDVSDLDSVRDFCDAFLNMGKKLDYLVANAGVMATPTEKMSKQGFESQFATNHLGHYLMLRLLEEKLMESGSVDHPARVVFVSSEAHEWWENRGNGTKLERLKDQVPPTRKYCPMSVYGFTKALNVLTAKAAQQRFGPSGNVVSVALHPGIIETGLLQEASGIEALMFSPLYRWMRKDIPQGAATTIHSILAPSVVDETRRETGSYYYDNALSKATSETQDLEVASEVWKLSEDLVKSWLP
mmetsp:Transcript_25070/g.54554  ORF Transcript_25070/g.54554 Transcript_25070/m.54554 type:complete len:397 (-) Transcript_25070:399-1589(-)